MYVSRHGVLVWLGQYATHREAVSTGRPRVRGPEQKPTSAPLRTGRMPEWPTHTAEITHNTESSQNSKFRSLQQPIKKKIAKH